MRSNGALLAVVLGCCLIPSAVVTPAASAEGRKSSGQDVKTLRIATLAPRGSIWMRVFKAWDKTLQKETGGKLKLRFYPGGVAGDERDVIRKMASGQMDGASVTSVGLAQVVRSVLVLQMPGLFQRYKQIDAVRGALAGELEQEFQKNGYQLLGWGDAGRGRIFSNKPIKKPTDLRSVRPWVWRDDPIFPEFLKAVGATGVPLGVPEVYPALQTRRIDAFPSSALAAVSLQWFTRATHVTKQSDSVLIGATILKKDTFDALPKQLQVALATTGVRAHKALTKAIRKDDDVAYKTMLKRGIQEVDVQAHEAEWKEAARKTRERLAGRLYSKELLRRVEKISRSN